MTTSRTDHESWYAVGKPVGELAYLGHGRYESQVSTVVRVTDAMVFTDSGRRFWRRKNARNEVGSRNRQIINPGAVVFRLVPRDHPRVLDQFPITPTSKEQP